MLRSLDRSAEAGITLIELVVAMVLFSLIGGLATAAITDGMRNHKQSLQQNKIESHLRSSVAQLREDLAVAKSPARDAMSSDELADALASPSAIAGDARDILIANPYRLRFRATVFNESTTDPAERPAQCVTWEVQNGWLTRVVQSGIDGRWNTMAGGPTNCRGAVLETDRMLPLPQYENLLVSAAGAAQHYSCAPTDMPCLTRHHTPIFSFVELVPNVATNECDSLRRPRNFDYALLPAGGGIAFPPQRVAPINGIVNVGIDGRGRFDPDRPPMSADGKPLGQSFFAADSSRTTVALKSRTTLTYTTALGCVP